MRCPACQNDAVAGAVFCNHCGAPIPVTCHQCTATNPSPSKFCHRCGATLSSADDIPTTSTSSTTEPTLGDVAVDFKVLAVDVARYSAPRIRTGAIFAARISKRSVISAAAGVKRISATIARRANRPKPSTGEPVPGQESPPAAPSRPVAVALSPDPETPATDPPPNEGNSIACPRCRTVNQPGSIFCFNCGLPLDEAAPAVRPAPRYTGAPGGFWIRFAAAMIDTAIFIAVQLTLIAIWPGVREYFDSDSLFHWVDVLLLLLTALYYTIGVSVWSTTVGKRICGLRVLRPDGAKVGPGRALARYCASGVSFVTLGIGYLMIAFRSDKRGLHDVICDTVVIRT